MSLLGLVLSWPWGGLLAMSPNALWWWSMFAVALGAGGLGMEAERLLNNRRLRHRQDAREAEAQRRWTERIAQGDTEWDRAIDEALRRQARREHPSFVEVPLGEVVTVTGDGSGTRLPPFDETNPNLMVQIDGQVVGRAYPKKGTWAEYVQPYEGSEE